MLNVLSFFFIMKRKLIKEIKRDRFDAQCFELFLYNELYLSIYEWCRSFDAQCSELFLYLCKENKEGFGVLWVSMLNVLSFFFIAHSTTAMNKRLLRGISEETSPYALFIHFYHYTMINKAVENCSEKILKLKIISPPLLYKYL